MYILWPMSHTHILRVFHNIKAMSMNFFVHQTQVETLGLLGILLAHLGVLPVFLGTLRGHSGALADNLGTMN